MFPLHALDEPASVLSVVTESEVLAFSLRLLRRVCRDNGSVVMMALSEK